MAQQLVGIGTLADDGTGDPLRTAFNKLNANDTELYADKHTHSNKVVLDASTASYTTAEETKLIGIETLADVTDATNVNAAGAVMESDIDTTPMGFVIDEDSMVSNLNTKAPTQQSVKAYVDAAVVSQVVYKGGYDAATNTPNLDSTPSGIKVGYMYTVTAAGNFFTVATEVGDVLICEQDNPTLESHWTVVNKDLNAASIKVSYESNADTNAYTDAEKTKLAGIEALADVTDVTNVMAAGALMDSEVDADIKTFSLPANTTISAFGATLVDDADEATARGTIGAMGLSALWNVQTGVTYTLAASDNGKIIGINNAAAIAVTLPDTLATNFQCTIVQLGAGVPTVTPNTDTINGAGTGVSPSAQYKAMYLSQYTATTWVAVV